MASFLKNAEAIGRANPVGQIQAMQMNDSALKTQAQNRAVTDLDMQRKRQVIDTAQRQIDAQIQEEKSLDQPRPIEVLKMKFEGRGEQGTAGAYALELARQNGLIDMSQGGEGTITKRNQKKFGALLSQPIVVKKLSRMRINTGRQQVEQAKQMLAKNPTDPKAQQAFQQAATFLTQALGSDKAISDQMAKIKEAQGFTLSQGQQRFDSSGRRIASVPGKPTAGASPKEKELKSLRDDFQQIMGRYMSSKRGTDQYVPSPNQEAVTGEAKEQARMLAERYQELGGNVRDLGISEDSLGGGGQKNLTEEMALDFLQKADGDKTKARQMAEEEGYVF